MKYIFEVVIMVIIFIIMVVIAKYYTEKEIEEEEIKKKKEYEELHTLNGRIKYYRNVAYSTYKLDEYKIGEWEKVVRTDMSSIVKINDKYKANIEINILIGDYDKMSVSNSVCVLESMGLNVKIAKSGIEIMERLNNGEKYDLIITNNIYDRGCDGPILLQELRNCNCKIPVVVLTVSQNARDKFISEGFNEYMSKLLDQGKIIKTLPNVIEDLKFEKI